MGLLNKQTNPHPKNQNKTRNTDHPQYPPKTQSKDNHTTIPEMAQKVWFSITEETFRKKTVQQRTK